MKKVDNEKHIVIKDEWGYDTNLLSGHNEDNLFTIRSHQNKAEFRRDTAPSM